MIVYLLSFFVFFFKQKTAYEMRISDWSSDVCSSDLQLPDAWSTGSSIMPQKSNPDAAELVRGRAGLLLGAFQRLAVIVKGLPLTYSKDMQDDKETVFGAFDALALSLAAMTGLVETLTFRTDRMRARSEEHTSELQSLMRH